MLSDYILSLIHTVIINSGRWKLPLTTVCDSSHNGWQNLRSASRRGVCLTSVLGHGASSDSRAPEQHLGFICRAPQMNKKAESRAERLLSVSVCSWKVWVQVRWANEGTSLSSWGSRHITRLAVQSQGAPDAKVPLGRTLKWSLKYFEVGFCGKIVSKEYLTRWR